jgi:hypothetical protein
MPHHALRGATSCTIIFSSTRTSRYHRAWDQFLNEMPLSTDPLRQIGTGNNGKTPIYETPTLTVDLEQHWLERVPRVMLSEDLSAECHSLTLDEAEQLANGLLAAVRAGRGEDQ